MIQLRNLLLGLTAVIAVGCGSDSPQAPVMTAKEHLEEVGQMLQTVAADKQRPPSRLAELEAVEPMLPTAANEIRSGQIVYFWGAGLSKGGAASSTVIAHEKKVPTEGGWVLLQDGTVKQMTADEFKNAPKAKR